MSPMLCRWARVAAMIALSALELTAQTNYGTIRGVAQDASASVQPGVEVTLTNLATGGVVRVHTNEAGNYVAPNLVPGDYRLSAAQEGFKTFVAERIQLASAQDVRVDIRLELGALSESITVTEGVQLIETERATLSETKSHQVFSALPVNSNYRSIWRIMLLSPGVSGGGFGSNIAGNNRGSNSTFNIDGIPMVDGWSGNAIGPAFSYLDGYREFRVDIAGSDASVGTTGAVTVISEGGTNEFHGEAWLHYNAIGFLARPFFAPQAPSGPPIYRPNVKVGGPILRDRTFFHFTWQALRGSQLPQVSNFVVPSTPLRGGDFSGLAAPVIDPLNGEAFPNNIVPANRISSVSKYFQDTFYPAANSGADRFTNVAVFPNTDDQYMTRVDHKISNANSVFVRLLFHRFTFENFQDGNPAVGIYNQYRNQDNVVVSDTHTFSSNMFNEFRFGWGADDSAFHGPQRGLDVVQASGLHLGSLPDVAALPGMNIGGFKSLTQASQGGWRWSNFYVAETLNYLKGRHHLKIGVDWARYNGRLIPTSPSAAYGSYSFNGRFSGNSYADFLLGIPDASSRSTSVSPVYRHRMNWAFYATDSFKVNPRLSLDFSLRYSWLDPGYTEENLVANFDPSSGALVIPDDAARARIHPGFPRNVPIVTAHEVGLGRRLARLDKNNFAPRLGFAWRPTQDGTLVVRGGAGIYYVALQPNAADGGGAPFELAESFTNSLVNGAPAFAFPNPFPDTAFVLGGTSASGMNAELRTPYSMQYNFTIEKQVLDMGISASYVSTLSRKNVWRRNLNQPVADTRPYEEKYALRPYPHLFSATFADNGGSHSYHALLLRAERRFAGGLFYSTNLTWAKSVGDDWSGVEDAFNRRRERSQGDQIPRWRFVGSALYELPFGTGKALGANAPKALNYVLGNWSLSGTWVAQTGTWFTPSFFGPDPSNTQRFNGRPDRIADGNLAASQRTVARWFDTAAFVAPAAGIGRFGNAGNHILEGPGLNVFHFGLAKKIPLTERVHMDLEMASTNFFNHPNFNPPSAEIGSSSYGQLLSTVDTDGNRNFQFTVRLSF